VTTVTPQAPGAQDIVFGPPIVLSPFLVRTPVERLLDQTQGARAAAMARSEVVEPVPAPRPKRSRQSSPQLPALLRHAREIGATSVTYKAAVINLTGGGQPQANGAGEPECNEWDEKYGPH